MKRTRQTRTGLWVLGVTWLFAGCGGRVIDDSGPGTVETGGAHAAGGAGKSGTGRPSTTLPTTPLGDCVPGFDHLKNPGLPCRWLSDTGQCFDNTDAACACICPTDRDSVCVHGFDAGPNGAKLIFCD